jgi:hypothetical protein
MLPIAEDMIPPADDFWAKTLDIIEKEKKFAPNLIITEDDILSSK